MVETFRLKVAGRRQVTLPNRVLELLHLAEGDVLEISVEGNSFHGRALKLVPTNLFTKEILKELQRREEEMSRGEGLEVKDSEELTSKLRGGPAHAASQYEGS